MKFASLLLLFSLTAMTLQGCSGSSDSSDGFKPPPAQSKADIQKQIDTVNADPSMQPAQKQMVISNLQKKLDGAK